MRIVKGATLVVAAMVGLSAATTMAAPYVYPGKGQSPEQQAKDSAECQTWARSQTGTSAGAPPPSGGAGQHTRGAVGGAARGAGVGAAVGAIGGDAGKGAAAGAVVGGVAGRRRAKQAGEQQAAAAANAVDRAFAACMEGRGYTVR